LLTVFLTGLMVGAAAAILWPRQSRSVRVIRGDGLESDLQSLGISAAQRARIDSVLTASYPKSEAVLRAVIPRLEALSDSIDDAIRAELTPVQRQRLDSLVARRGARPRSRFVLKRRIPIGVAPETLPTRPQR
jgi:hypothetical protein